MFHSHFSMFLWPIHVVTESIWHIFLFCLHSNGQFNSLWPPPCVGSPIGSASSWPSSCTAALPHSSGVLSVGYLFSAPPLYLLVPMTMRPQRPTTMTFCIWKVPAPVVMSTSPWPSWPCFMWFTWWNAGTAFPRQPCWLMLNSRYLWKTFFFICLL